jgi:phosphatidylglycerol:prolipoprotein diacylglycerol transferase
MLASAPLGMHPVLLSLDLSGWRLPLLPWLSLATVGLATATLIGWRMRRLEMTVSLGIATTIAGIAAVALREQAFAPRSFVITTYGALLALSLVIGWWWTTTLATREGEDREVVSRACLVTLFVGIAGARVGHVLMHPPSADQLARAFDLRSGGLSGYAGLALGLAALVLALRGTDVSWRRVADAACPAVVLGLVAVRVGGYLSGSAFGRPLPLDAPPWLRDLGTFPRWSDDVLGGAGSPAWTDQVARGLIQADSLASLPVHPTQLYLAAGAVGLLVLVVWLRKVRRFSGEVFLAVVFGYGLLRFVVDCWRADPQRLLLGPPLPAAVVVGVGLFALGVAFLLGPARDIEQVRWRQGTWAITLGLALLGALIAHRVDVVRPSVSQWVGLLSALVAAGAWRPWARVLPLPSN